MLENKHWLSDQDYNLIYSKVPRLNLDIVIHKDNGIVMVKRSIEPWINHWHLPGGTLYKGEVVHDATIRIAKAETGLDVEFVRSVDYMEFIGEERGDLNMHTVTIVIETNYKSGELLKDKNADEIKVINSLKEVSPIIEQFIVCLTKHYKNLT